MRGRMFVSGVLVLGLVASLSGCGTEEAACFEGPSVTYTAQFFDWFSGDPLEGVGMCQMDGDASCGCRASNAMGHVDIELPASSEVVVRIADGIHLTLRRFYTTPDSGIVGLAYDLMTRTLAQGLAASLFGTELDPSRGTAIAYAFPDFGYSMEGTRFELLSLDGTAAAYEVGPIYVSTDGSGFSSDLEAESSVGTQAYAIWGNVLPGRYVVRGYSATGENVFERCALQLEGWERRNEGELVLEMEVFPEETSDVARRGCVP
jgi:hypothetical protein